MKNKPVRELFERSTIWNNEDNEAFYEAIKAEGLKKFAEEWGVATCCDVRTLMPYWSKADFILDVGAGYGRAIDYLLKHQFKGKITAIERCDVLFEYLKKRFISYDNVDLIHADILSLDLTNNLNNRCDLIFLLWGFISNFPPAEQLTVLSRLSKLLKKDGKLVIDTVSREALPVNSKQNGNQHYELEFNEAIMNFHLPNFLEIQSYAQKAGFSNISHINYQTDIGHIRQLHIVS